MYIYSNKVLNKKTPVNQRRKELTGNNTFFLNKKINFKGLPKYLEAAEKFGEDFGDAAGKHFKNIIEQANRSSNSGLKINADGTVTFDKEQPLSKRALEMIAYPVTDLPKDLANGVIGGLKKISWFERRLSGLSDKSSFFKKLEARKQAVENKSNVAAIKHYLELLSKGDDGYLKRFTEAHRKLVPLMPNYNSESERSLTRLVTGLIPAFFLANDAYNLSMYMNNNKEVAKKEKKRRFRQEAFRIGATSLLTYEILHLFSKQANKSMYAAAGLISGIALVSEIIGRYFAGNPVLPLSAEKAKEYAQKRKELKQNNTSEPTIQKNTENKSAKKEFLTMNNVLKVLGGLIVFGFAAEKVSKIPTISKKIGEFKDWYKGLYTEKYTIKRERFDKLMDKLYENDFKKIAGFYENMIENQKGEKITIGHVENKQRYILIHQILTFPVRFAWQTITFPYKIVSKPIMKLLEKENKTGEKVSKDLNKYKSKFEDEKEITMLQNSIKFLEKIEHDKEFTKKVNQRLVSSLDNLTKSSYSNADLSTVTRITSNAVTSIFLIADNYNMVMIDSQGDDKNLAQQKAKERTIQRAVKIIYGAFIVKIMNDIFKAPYNSSLLGAQAVNVGNVLITESLERKSVGLPLHEATQKEIKENEREHLSATGLKGSYFRAMAKLTGKKPLSENNKS